MHKTGIFSYYSHAETLKYLFKSFQSITLFILQRLRNTVYNFYCSCLMGSMFAFVWSPCERKPNYLKETHLSETHLSNLMTT